MKDKARRLAILVLGMFFLMPGFSVMPFWGDRSDRIGRKPIFPIGHNPINVRRLDVRAMKKMKKKNTGNYR